MTKSEHFNLKKGDIITREDEEYGLGVWVVDSKKKPREDTFYYDLIVHNSSPGIWCEFTLANSRRNLSEYKLLSRIKYPEYYL